MTLLEDQGIDPATCEECGAVRGEFCREGCPNNPPDTERVSDDAAYRKWLAERDLLDQGGTDA